MFYGCVRLRMHVGPLIKDRFGNTARRAYWLLTILAMIIIGNAALLLLRKWLPQADSSLLEEIWFLAVAVCIAYALIFRRIAHRNKKTGPR